MDGRRGSSPKRDRPRPEPRAVRRGIARGIGRSATRMEDGDRSSRPRDRSALRRTRRGGRPNNPRLASDNARYVTPTASKERLRWVKPPRSSSHDRGVWGGRIRCHICQGIMRPPRPVPVCGHDHGVLRIADDLSQGRHPPLPRAAGPRLATRPRRRPRRVESNVVEDPPRERGLGDEGDELHPAAGLGAGEEVEREHLLQQAGPRDAVGPGRLLCGLLARWLLRSAWRWGLWCGRCRDANARRRHDAPARLRVGGEESVIPKPAFRPERQERDTSTGGRSTRSVWTDRGRHARTRPDLQRSRASPPLGRARRGRSRPGWGARWRFNGNDRGRGCRGSCQVGGSAAVVRRRRR